MFCFEKERMVKEAKERKEKKRKDLLQAKGPQRRRQFNHEEARKHQADDAEGLEGIVPGVGQAFLAQEEADDKVYTTAGKLRTTQTKNDSIEQARLPFVAAYLQRCTTRPSPRAAARRSGPSWSSGSAAWSACCVRFQSRTTPKGRVQRPGRRSLSGFCSCRATAVGRQRTSWAWRQRGKNGNVVEKLRICARWGSGVG